MTWMTEMARATGRLDHRRLSQIWQTIANFRNGEVDQPADAGNGCDGYVQSHPGRTGCTRLGGQRDSAAVTTENDDSNSDVSDGARWRPRIPMSAWVEPCALTDGRDSSRVLLK